MHKIDLARLKEAKSILQAAHVCLDLGLTPVPLNQDGSGKPLVRWGTYNPTIEKLPSYFNKACNLAIAGGSKSSDVADIDIDQDDAIDLAKIAFPGAVTFGRGARKHSHMMFRCEGGITAQFAAPAEAKEEPLWQRGHKLMIIESQSEGKLITIPPSVHRSQQSYEWDSNNAILPEFDADEVLRRLRAIAVLTVFIRHYPGEGERNNGCLAMSGLLVRGGIDPELVDDFIRCAARVAGDEDWQTRGGAVGAADRIRRGLSVPGIPRVVEILSLKDYWKPWFRRILFPRKAERVIDPKNPLNVARSFVADVHTKDECRLLQRYEGAYYLYDGTRYKQLDRRRLAPPYINT